MGELEGPQLPRGKDTSEIPGVLRLHRELPVCSGGEGKGVEKAVGGDAAAGMEHPMGREVWGSCPAAGKVPGTSGDLAGGFPWVAHIPDEAGMTIP